MLVQVLPWPLLRCVALGKWLYFATLSKHVSIWKAEVVLSSWQGDWNHERENVREGSLRLVMRNTLKDQFPFSHYPQSFSSCCTSRSQALLGVKGDREWSGRQG